MAAGQEQVEALIIGAGPAGLMAAEMLAQAGHRVVLVEAKPSIARKLLMAGKSGLNLTKAEDPAQFRVAYGTAADWLAPMLEGFGPDAVQDWARGLGQPVFTGSTGRVFPKAMKASPLVRAWAARLGALGVERRTRWRWTGWDGAAVLFDTPEGPRRVLADATVLALGGASWARLGSDGAWAAILEGAGIALTPFAPANAGIRIDWSPHMARHFGAPVKGAALRAGTVLSRGEFVISARGLEGGGVYPLSQQIRAGAALHADLLPDREAAWITARLARPRGKATVAAHLRKSLKLDPARLALLQEFGRPLPDTPEGLAHCIKALPIAHAGLRPLDEAISTAGGVPRAALDDGLMLTARPGTFCAGEMLDWEAPTGGYLLTGCLATGRHAGRAAGAWLSGGTLDAGVEISPRLS
ncbi:TIGR03862 family flavoprotein [Fluviibacterium sp. S390]|uniref:TIGR03862 family flavoprotein n=1 Tax=Fluviibacterium sp. S390 TaxID=3415139 RepID=UPI003C7DB526